MRALNCAITIVIPLDWVSVVCRRTRTAGTRTSPISYGRAHRHAAQPLHPDALRRKSQGVDYFIATPTGAIAAPVG